MLDTIRFKLEAILTDCGDLDNAKKIIKKITDDIRAYNDENKLKTDMHGTFRVIEEYDTDIKEQLYNARLNYFECMPENTFRRAVQNTSQKAEKALEALNCMKEGNEGLI